MQTAQINWSYSGGIDPLCGTGATAAERILAYGMATVFTGIILVADQSRNIPIAEGWQIALLAFFAFDIAGGAVANMLNSCKRFYHTPLQSGEGMSARLAKNPMLFTVIHVHPIIIAYALGGNVLNSVIWYALLLVSVTTVLFAPLYLRRAAATGLTVLALLGNQLLLPLGGGLEWFIPCLFIKMVLGHAVQEEPYRAG
ncbi:hypothetical protein GCM10007385_21230 [Tateyamaria omphalii]|uniref:hypothetical protein n=1 Tax=Tateyamaria omphalii TaxID=299262 RepID=UPI0016773563|nr:hypothetical protein [Tateyamaria omphalii]GGX52314.1 hypothetical protein GCM10007385_21230 [Tateyamaria omphalii]